MNRPINIQTGTVPDVSGALKDQFQLLVFTNIMKAAEAFQVVENPTSTSFWGLIQPFKPRDLLQKPEGERAWTWMKLWAEPVLQLQVDDLMTYLGVQTRVMARTNFTLYGYIEYVLVQDWTGSGPNPPTNQDWDGGNAFTTFWPNTADGGNANVD